MSTRWLDCYGIAQRIEVTARLELLTPARFGGGEDDSLADMPLLRDARDRRPLLTGASIAGALRNYLREWELGYGKTNNQEPNDSLTRLLFGDVCKQDGKEVSLESFLAVDDAWGYQPGEGEEQEMPDTELRDGVVIDGRTRLARRGGLFDAELLEAGTCFDLHFSLAVPEDKEDFALPLAVALTGLERGEIGLGYRKRRGLGECKVAEWKVQSYNLRSREGLLGWLESGAGHLGEGSTIGEKLGFKKPLNEMLLDLRQRLILQVAFRLESSLLIRSGIGDGKSPDMVHLQSMRNGRPEPILSGSSLAGALRGRALKIARLKFPAKAEELVDDMFGSSLHEDQSPGQASEQAAPGRKKRSKARASRLSVREGQVQKPAGGARVQSRVRIDRFTGGSYPTGLFTQQPALGGKDTRLEIHMELRQPQVQEIRLLLHLLQDLCTADLPLGGEASVGRGRLCGVWVKIDYENQHWHFEQQPDGQIQFLAGDAASLERLAGIQEGEA